MRTTTVWTIAGALAIFSFAGAITSQRCMGKDKREVVVNGARLTNKLVVIIDVSGSMTELTWSQYFSARSGKRSKKCRKQQAAINWASWAAEAVGDEGEVQIVAFATSVWRSKWHRMPDADWLNAALWQAQSVDVGNGTTAGVEAVVGALRQRDGEAISLLVISDMKWQQDDVAAMVAATRGRKEPAPIAVVGIDSGSSGAGDRAARDMAAGGGGMYIRITTDKSK